MKVIKRKEIDQMDKVFRLNLINSISGYKSANLIGSNGQNGDNLAVFSSVIHLGSNPPLLGFIMRPATVPRHTLSNIRENKYYTINHIHSKLIERAHYTSAKFQENESEFDACQIEKQDIEGFSAPFVKESTIKMGMKLVEEVPIAVNGTILIIGEIEFILVDQNCIEENGQLNLNHADIACISGLNRYHLPQEIGEFPYARREELPDFQ